MRSAEPVLDAKRAGDESTPSRVIVRTRRPSLDGYAMTHSLPSHASAAAWLASRSSMLMPAPSARYTPLNGSSQLTSSDSPSVAMRGRRCSAAYGAIGCASPSAGNAGDAAYERTVVASANNRRKPFHTSVPPWLAIGTGLDSTAPSRDTCMSGVPSSFRIDTTNSLPVQMTSEYAYPSATLRGGPATPSRNDRRSLRCHVLTTMIASSP